MLPVPPFTDEHEQFRETVRAWVTKHLRPRVDGWERACAFPDEVFLEVAAQGWFGLAFDETHGGDADPVANAVLAEELVRCGSGGVAAGLGAHAHIALPPVAAFGTPDQKQRYLVPGMAGEKIAALGITEPGAGSDVAGLRTTARAVDGGYVVNGSKLYITNGIRASFVVTAVRTREGGGHRGISLMIVDTDQAGYQASPLEKLGWHASDTAEIAMSDVFVPSENLLGPLHEGFKVIMANFQWERLVMSLVAVGAMQEAFDRTVGFVGERAVFGAAMTNLQTVRHTLADLETTIHVARSVTYDAVRRHAAGENAMREVTMAKLYTQRAAVEVIDACLQLHGGAGYMREYEIERMFRDARLGPIGGGTDEIMREILGKAYAP
ncbi:MAG: acyl-CoA dehydrogenase [Solirubrobacteraceae bacterium]|jgi:acyl-CoA dehydrogenase|nr:acyl-CoA dehydrogenase [Solirubrobacteraceae bacterium]